MQVIRTRPTICPRQTSDIAAESLADISQNRRIVVERVLHETIGCVKVGEERSFQNLTMFPLLAEDGREPDYLLLDEALAQGCARVTEVSHGGSVPELKFVNDSDQRILLIDGEELIGSKQNRVLNLTILVSAKSEIAIPVSCVEAGRWRYDSETFASSARLQYAKGRARKNVQVSESLRHEGGRRSDQQAVWADIDAKASRMSARSETNAMANIYEQHSASIEDYVRSLTAVEGQTGAFFVLNGADSGSDLFDCSATLGKILPKLIRSYALDALDSLAGESQPAERSVVESLLQQVVGATSEQFPALGEGEDVRLTGERLTGAGLIADGRVIHLSAFSMPDEEDRRSGHQRTSLSRPSVRRRQQRSS